MSKNKVVNWNKDFILKIVTVYERSTFNRKDGSQGTIQTIDVELESGNKTKLKIWNGDEIPEYAGGLMKVLQANDVQEEYEGTSYVNIHTTKNTTIIYPFNQQTHLDKFIPPANKVEVNDYTQRIDALQNTIAELNREVEALKQNVADAMHVIADFDIKFSKQVLEHKHSKGQVTLP